MNRVVRYVTDLSAVEVRAATMPGRDALRVGNADELRPPARWEFGQADLNPCYRAWRAG